MGDPTSAGARLNQYITKLQSQLLELKGLMKAFVESGTPEDANSLHKLAHRIHGTAGVLGFQRESEFAEQVEAAVVSPGEPSGNTRGIVRQLLGGFDWDVEPKSSRETGIAALLAADRSLVTESPVVPPRVLLIEDDPDFVEQLVQMGRSSLVDVLSASTVDEAVAIASKHSLQGVIVDYYLGDLIGVDIALQLREFEQFRDLPFAFVSVDDSLSTRVACSHAGGVFFLEKPVSDNSFSTLLRRFAAMAERVRSRILLVDDDPDLCLEVANWLVDEGWAVQVEHDARRLLERCREWRPELAILDLQMPHLSGLECCRLLRTSMHWADLPVIFLTANKDPETQAQCYEAGADDFVDKPIIRQKLIARVRNRLERQVLLKHQAERDALTGVLNRSAFLQRCDMRLAEASRQDTTATLCLMDMDDFKRINTIHGHLYGDDVLRSFGRKLISRFRLEDLRCRWGGEEFVLLLVGSNIEEAECVMERLLEEFAKLEFTSPAGKFSVTCSVGLAQFPGDGGTLSSLISVADRRLHYAKDQGKNRVVIADPTTPSDDGVDRPVLAMIVEDPSSAKALRDFVMDTHELHVISDIGKAQAEVSRHQPDVIFVDNELLLKHPELRPQLRKCAPNSSFSRLNAGRVDVDQFLKLLRLASTRGEKLARAHKTLAHLHDLQARILGRINEGCITATPQGLVTTADEKAMSILDDRNLVGRALEAIFPDQQLNLAQCTLTSSMSEHLVPYEGRTLQVTVFAHVGHNQEYLLLINPLDQDQV
ncbi:MAG: hypothetical protein DHS20C11_04990 [Lysobacteraceae bacterium]|nr:MAG: hypothetical protein DHS20C11_04990 [Xanthomonadaceae bacterium]